MPPFTFVTASGLVKLAGSNPPGYPGRNSGPIPRLLWGIFLSFFRNSLYKSPEIKYNIICMSISFLQTMTGMMNYELYYR